MDPSVRKGIVTMKRTLAVLIALVMVVVAACAGRNDGPALSAEEQQLQSMVGQTKLPVLAGHRIAALGAFSCDFALDMTLLQEPLGATIERDRIFLQRSVLEETVPTDPGMIQKHIPFLPTGPTSAFGGGRYLFQGRVQAALYSRTINETFVYPEGTQFLERPEFSDAECRDWTALLAWNFAPIETHTAVRTERFDTGLTSLSKELGLAGKLLLLAPSLLQEAQARGYAEVHLLHSLADHKVQLVYLAPRMSGPDPNVPDVAAFGKLSSDPKLGSGLPAELGLAPVLDRTAFVLTTWLPYAAGDQGAASLWPNSPPIPAPSCGDAVCTPSRAETGASCPADCAPGCGDAVCGAGEDLHRCPSDCGQPF